MARHLDPDGVDEDDLADEWCGQHGHLGGDPAPDRVPHDRDVVHAELLEQRHVQRREPADGVQRLRPGRAAEARVDRADHPGGLGLREQGAETGDRVGSAAPVQQQDRPALSLLIDGDVHRPDAVELDVIGGDHDLS